MTTDNTSTEQRKFEEGRFEFILYINKDRYIVQRTFNIKDYNENSLQSYEFKELLDNIGGMNNGPWGKMGIIPNYLKEKSYEYLWNNYNPYYTQPDEYSRNIYDGKVDTFQFEIKVDKVSVGIIEFEGNVFPPKVRYDVNIRELLPLIINEIKTYLRQKEYTLVEA